MIVGILKMNLFARGIHNLKEKRRIVLSLKEKLKRKFNISIVESGDQDIWQKIEFSIAIVSNQRSHVEKTFQQIEEMTESGYPVEVIRIESDFY